uniref:Tol-pal system protein YbgF n=1 Tax=Thermodesulfobacterium geofontis TaxID=1295609 RepID=A0A7V4N3D3_9BACT
MNKNFFLLFLLPLILVGCIASQDEIQTLKIKVINLETTLNKQNQKSEELEKKLDELNKMLISLENKLSKDMIVEIKTQVLSELDEMKKEQTQLSSQVEEIKFSQEESEKNLKTQLENLVTQTQALELKIKELEKKLETISKEPPKETSSPSNATVTSPDNATKIAAIKPEEKSEEKPLSEAQFYDRAYSYYQKGDFKNAKKFFEEYIEKFPKGSWIGQAYFWIGEIYFKEQKYEEAILNYQKLIELPGWHPLKPSAMLKQAQAFKALGDTEAYKILLKKLINQYPQSKEAEVAKKLLK